MPYMRLLNFCIVFLVLQANVVLCGEIPDTLRLGDPVSEKQHKFRNERGGSKVVKGGLNEPARFLLPPPKPDPLGSSIHFTLKVDPNNTNYLTVKLWGEDTSRGRLTFYLDGKQLGYRHLGDYDLIAHSNGEANCAGRFYYVTTLIPPDFTRDKTSISCEIRSLDGPVAPNASLEEYRKHIEAQSRGIYAVYSHTNCCFTPPTTEKQGRVPESLPLRSGPGPEAMERIKERICRESSGLLASDRPIDQVAASILARSSRLRWSSAFENAGVAEQVVKCGDWYYRRFVENPDMVHNFKETAWPGLGPLGAAIRIVFKDIEGNLDEKIENGKGETIVRRDAWATMLRHNVDWHRSHRRMFTNQAMIIDMFIYHANRALALLDPKKALPEEQALRYLHECVGLAPWRGSDLPGGTSDWRGPDYYIVTKKGLSRELGYVGGYGEILHWASYVYLATCNDGWFDADMNHPGGDPALLEHLRHMGRARSVFRHPSSDRDGCRAMRLETVIGWRDIGLPGPVIYAARSTREGSELLSPILTLDKRLVGALQQMAADNQLFVPIDGVARDRGWDQSLTAMVIPDLYEKLKGQPARNPKLPMSDGEPDFVWTDEENAVVAVKHGDEIVYMNLYWRSRYGVNGLAKIHAINPNFERIAIVRERTFFEPEDGYYTRNNWTDMGFGRGGHPYPGNGSSLHEGERLPIVKMPKNTPFRIGHESIFAGRCDAYQLKYGKYLVFMNCEADKVRKFRQPGFSGGVDLISGKTFEASVELPPLTTAVFYGDFETKMPESVYRAFPHNGAENLPATGFTIAWQPGERNESYRLYFGKNMKNGHQKIDLKATSWKTGPLESDTEYCYRIDTINAAGTTKGEVCRFRTMPVQTDISWTQTNIGSRGKPGRAIVSGNRMDMEAGGLDIWDNADNAFFLNVLLEGDATLIGRLVSQEDTDQWAKAGIMVRKSLEPGSTRYGVLTSPKHGTFVSRRHTDGIRTQQIPLGPTGASIWFKMTRSGGFFHFFTSRDGADWNLQRIEDFIEGPIYIGFAGCSCNENRTGKVVFDNVILIRE